MCPMKKTVSVLNSWAIFLTTLSRFSGWQKYSEKGEYRIRILKGFLAKYLAIKWYISLFIDGVEIILTKVALKVSNILPVPNWIKMLA